MFVLRVVCSFCGCLLPPCAILIGSPSTSQRIRCMYNDTTAPLCTPHALASTQSGHDNTEDALNESFVANFNITIKDTNDKPESASLDAHDLNELAGAGTLVGRLVAMDEDTDDVSWLTNCGICVCCNRGRCCRRRQAVGGARIRFERVCLYFA